MKRSVNVGVSVALSALVLFGCQTTDAQPAGQGENGNADGSDSTDEPAGDVAEPVVLTFGAPVPEGSAVGPQLAERWLKEVEERSGGEIKFERFWAGALCDVTEGLACVRDGRADLYLTAPGNHPAEFPSHLLASLPTVSSNLAAETATWIHLAENNEVIRGEHERQGVKPMIWYPNEATVMSNVPLQGPSDLARLDVRATGYLGVAFENLGANTFAIPVTEFYESHQRGMLQATVTDLTAAIRAFSLHEVTDYAYDLGLGSFLVSTVWISQDRFDAIPPHLQDLMLEVAEEQVDWFIELEAAAAEAICDDAIEGGLHVEQWDEASREELRDMVSEDVVEAWVEDMADAGVTDARSVLEDYRGSLERFESRYEQVESSLATCAGRVEREE